MTTLHNGITFRRTTREGLTPVEFWGDFVGYAQHIDRYWIALNKVRVPIGTHSTRTEAANALVDRKTRHETLDAMPLRSVRVDDARWRAAAAQAERDGTTISQIIRDALDAYATKGK